MSKAYEEAQLQLAKTVSISGDGAVARAHAQATLAVAHELARIADLLQHLSDRDHFNVREY